MGGRRPMVLPPNLAPQQLPPWAINTSMDSQRNDGFTPVENRATSTVSIPPGAIRFKLSYVYTIGNHNGQSTPDLRPISSLVIRIFIKLILSQACAIIYSMRLSC